MSNSDNSTNSIFQKGLSSAKASFEQILNSPVSIQELNYEKCDYKVDSSNQGNTYHLLRTQLMGDINGESFLIFSEEEIDCIIKKCLPENFWANETEEQTKMRGEFINEIDNILSSSVITEIANELDVFLYGGVPQPQLLDGKELNNFLKLEASAFESIIQFKAVFQGSELDISPNFIWMFNGQILEKIKK